MSTTIESTAINPTLSEAHELALSKPFALITGKAGSGKTTLIKSMAQLNPSYIQLAATTGIAAINLGGTTIHSVLKYFDTASLEKAYVKGYLHQKLRLIATRRRVLGIEEVSMLSAQQLDIIMAGIDDVNLAPGVDLGLHLIGDLCQLPPVSTPTSKADFCFKAANWKVFDDNTIHLDKIWRQDNFAFIAAINAIREGNGRLGVKLLKDCGVKFILTPMPKFEGTTLIPNNKDVDAYNTKRLAESPNQTIRVVPIRRGQQMKEWDNSIPNEQRFKVGAYVMILRNDSVNFDYVNGDCGTIESVEKIEIDKYGKQEVFSIRLVRTGEVVKIGRARSLNYQLEQPDENQFNSMFYPYLDEKNELWVTGYIDYHPIRLAYASTVHKSQGLSLDKLQIDSRPPSYGWPGICYVAVSRARNPEGLTIVGSESDFAAKVRTAPEVLKYI